MTERQLKCLVVASLLAGGDWTVDRVNAAGNAADRILEAFPETNPAERPRVDEATRRDAEISRGEAREMRESASRRHEYDGKKGERR